MQKRADARSSLSDLIWHTGVNGYANALQTAFNRLELSVTYEILEKLGARNAEKGRRPFFLIRSDLAYGSQRICKCPPNCFQPTRTLSDVRNFREARCSKCRKGQTPVLPYQI